MGFASGLEMSIAPHRSVAAERNEKLLSFSAGDWKVPV